MKSYSSLKTVLITKLEGILGQDSEALFVNVYSAEVTDQTGYPCAFVIESAGDGSLLDTARNEREWQFEIEILHEVGRMKPEDVSDSIIDAVDRVLESFDADPQLTVAGVNNAKKVVVVPVEIDFGTREGGYSRAVLRISIVDIVQRF